VFLTKNQVIWVCTAVAGCIAYFAWAWTSQARDESLSRSEPTVADLPKSAAPTAALGTATGLQAGTTAAALIDSNPNQAFRSSTSAYTTRDPYPEAVALWQARRKGTFGAAQQLVLHCMEANLHIGKDFNHWFSALPGATQAARATARQEIENRCVRFSGQDVNQFHKPVVGDSFGERYRSAAAAFTEASIKERLAEAVTEILSQGQIPSQRQLEAFTNPRTWRGVSWEDRADEFDFALSHAVVLASADSAPAGTDLRALTICYRFGLCSGNLIADSAARINRASPSRQAEVMALSKELAEALRSANLRPFLEGQQTPTSR
jgi:hypothetical protein